MCLAKVYEITEGDKLLLEDVAYMTIEGGRVEIENLFGERKILQAKVRQVDFLKSRVELERD